MRRALVLFLFGFLSFSLLMQKLSKLIQMSGILARLKKVWL